MSASDLDRDPIFAVQEHDESAHHYDFRLEVDGVLKSWAVPKGPSLDPVDRRLAVEVDDHALEHADFEGVAPPSRRGTGGVIIWDRGTYRNLHDGDGQDPLSMAESIGRGRVKVWLAGQKLRGGFTLIKTRLGGKDHNWLLKKLKDEEARDGVNVVGDEPRSVVSGRTMRELLADEE